MSEGQDTPHTDAKLDARKVRSIRERYNADPYAYGIITKLAREYGVAAPTMRDVVKGYSWRWVK